MQRGNAVRGMCKMDVHVCHVNGLPAVDDGSALIVCSRARKSVQLFNDRHELRHYLVEKMTRPLFQRLREDSVVGVGAGVGDDLHGFREVDALFAEKTDQFRDYHARMRVVDLNCRVVGEIVEIASARPALGKDELRSGGNHQILLINAQQASVVVGIVRIEKQCQIFFDIRLVEGDAALDQRFVDGIQIKQIETVGAPVVAGDVQLI